MIIFIHTITISGEEFQLSTHYYHALGSESKKAKLIAHLIGKRVIARVKKFHDGQCKRNHLKRNRWHSFKARHEFQAVKM